MCSEQKHVRLVICCVILCPHYHVIKTKTTSTNAGGICDLSSPWLVQSASWHICELSSYLEQYALHSSLTIICHAASTGSFRAQELSFPRTNSPYGELLFPRPFVPQPIHSRELGNKSSGELLFPGGNFSSQDFSFPGTFIPRPFYKVLAMNRRQL